MKYPLLRMFRWLSVAPLGRPVVPDVYWMFTASSACRPAAIEARRDSSGSTNSASHSGVPMRTTFCSSGALGRAASSMPA